MKQLTSHKSSTISQDDKFICIPQKKSWVDDEQHVVTSFQMPYSERQRDQEV